MAPEHMSPTRRLAWFFGLGLLLAVSFWAWDRLLFTALRVSAARYYASLGTDTLQLRKGTFYGSGDGDILVLGSSRARYAFAQDILSSRLNKRVVKEAGAGEFPKHNYYFYQKWRLGFPRPKLVLYGLDYFMFEKDSDLQKLARLGKNIELAALNPHGRVNPSWPLLSRVSWLFRMKPEIDGFLGDLMKFDRGAEAGGEDAPRAAPKPGRKRRPAGWKGRQTLAVKPESWATRAYRALPGVEGAYLERLLQDLEQDNVPVFLVMIPDYVGANDTNFEQAKFKADMRALAARFSRVRILDFNHADRFDLEDAGNFWDGAWGKSNCHLSLKGMKDFTARLAAELERACKDARAGTGPERRPGP